MVPISYVEASCFSFKTYVHRVHAAAETLYVSTFSMVMIADGPHGRLVPFRAACASATLHVFKFCFLTSLRISVGQGEVDAQELAAEVARASLHKLIRV
jgi:hypothetical protein